MYKPLLSFFFDSIFCLAAFYVIYWLLLRKEKTFLFNRIILLTSVIISFIVPLVSIVSLFSPKVVHTFSSATESNFLTATLNSTSLVEKSFSLVQQGVQFDLMKILLIIYLVVVTILIIKMITGFVKLIALVKQNEIQKKYDYTIVFLKKNFSPFSFFHFVFINEKEKNSESISKIIDHEKVHIDQKHTFDNLLLEISSAVQWYNPFIWLIKKEVKEIHEYLADEKVIAQGFESAEYSSFLLNQIVGLSAVNIANCFNKSLIKKRLLMMEKIKTSRLTTLKKLVVLPLIVVILAFTVNPLANTSVTTPNLNIQSGGDIPEGWFKAGSHPAEYDFGIDKSTVRAGNSSFLLASKSQPINGFGTLMQTISAENYLGKRLKLSGEIKTENSERGASLWMRVDGEKSGQSNQSLTFDNMYGREPKGTIDWQKYEIVLDVPQNAVTVNFGMMLMGTGKAWFANLNIEEVGSAVPVTDLKVKQNKPLPKNPVNLKLK